METYANSFRNELLKKFEPKFPVLRGNSIRIIKDILIVDGKAFYPDNCLIFNSMYYNRETRRLDILRDSYLVDSYYCAREFIDTKEMLLKWLKEKGYLLSNICYNIPAKTIPVIDGHNSIRLSNNPTDYLSIEINEFPIRGFITLVYFGYPIQTLFYKIGNNEIFIYNPTSGRLEYKTNNVTTFSSDNRKFGDIKDYLENLEYMEIASAEITNNLRISYAEVYSFINENKDVEIFNIGYHDPVTVSFIGQKELLEKCYKIIKFLLDNNYSWEDICNYGYDEPI